jgi:hypothetical protein
MQIEQTPDKLVALRTSACHFTLDIVGGFLAVGNQV